MFRSYTAEEIKKVLKELVPHLSGYMSVAGQGNREPNLEDALDLFHLYEGLAFTVEANMDIDDVDKLLILMQGLASTLNACECVVDACDRNMNFTKEKYIEVYISLTKKSFESFKNMKRSKKLDFGELDELERKSVQLADKIFEDSMDYMIDVKWLKKSSKKYKVVDQGVLEAGNKWKQYVEGGGI